MAVSPPCDITQVQQLLPQNLAPLYGKPTTNRRTDKYKKIVLYILAADDGKDGTSFSSRYPDLFLLQQSCQPGTSSNTSVAGAGLDRLIPVCQLRGPVLFRWLLVYFYASRLPTMWFTVYPRYPLVI